MAFVAPVVGLLGLAGSVMSAQGTIAGANAQSQALQYQAQVARQKGMQDKASAQRNALDTQLKTQLTQSTLQARASASGAGATDPTVTNLASNIAGRGEYQGLLQMWQGQIGNWNYETDARGKDAQASAIQSAAGPAAFGTILGGVGSMFRAFGGGGYRYGALPSGYDDGSYGGAYG